MTKVMDDLETLAHELDDKTKELASFEKSAVEAKRDYEVAYAKAYLADDNKGTVDDRKQRAVLRTADARFAAEVTAAQVRGCKEAIRALHARIEVGRTLASTVRAEMQMGGTT